MGANQSSTTINDIVTEVTTSFIVSTSQSCTQNKYVNQEFKLICGSGAYCEVGDVELNSKGLVDQECIALSYSELGLDTELATEILNKVEQELSDVPIDSSQKSEAITEITNIVTTYVESDANQELFNQVILEQTIEFEAKDDANLKVGAVTITDVNNLVQRGLLENNMVGDISNYIRNNVDNITEQKMSGFLRGINDLLSGIGDFFGNLGLAIVVVLAIVLMGIVGLGKGKGNKIEINPNN